MIDYRKILILYITVSMFATVSFVAAQDIPPGGEFSRERALGDKALKDGVYDLAIKSYKKYKEKSAGNTNAILDACKCLIAAYVNSGNSQKARDEFTFLTTKFAVIIAGKPQLRNELSYWDGNIVMESGDTRKAAEIFNNLQKKLPQKSELYYKTLDALGTAQARSLQWDKAEKTYAKLEFAAKRTSWQTVAARKKLLALIEMGNFKTAAALIKKTDAKGKIYIEVIKGILFLKKGDPAKAMTYYKKIRKSADGTDSLWFMLASNLADAFQEKKEYKNALFVLSDALLFACSEFERQKTIVRMINVSESDNNIKAAIAMAERFLKNYPDAFISNDISIRLAELYKRGEKPENALQVLTALLNDKGHPLDVKIKSAHDAAHIYINLKRYAEAHDMFRYMEENAPTSLLKGEGAFWIAELQYIEGKYLEAAESFATVAVKFPQWKERALFKEIKSLMNSDEYKKIIKRIEVFIKEYPESKYAANTAFLYALTLKNSGEKAKAEIKFAKFAKQFPSHTYAARALFEEGLLAMEAEKYSVAVSAFTQLYEKYPDNTLVPNVLYRRVYALFLEGFDKEAISDVQILMEKYTDSEYTIYAQFKLAEYYRGKKDIANAIRTLQNITEKYKAENSESVARAYYEIADIYFKDKKHEEAFKALDELSAKFPNEPISNNALFLRGEVFTQNNEYEKAIPFYIKTAKNVPGTSLEISAEGRIGDCYFAIGDKAKDGSNFTKAIEYYKKVLTHKKLTSFYRDQALYKIGRSVEAQGDKGEALLKYRQVVYGHEIDLAIEKTTARSSVWFAKSAISAANLYLEKDNPEAAEAAIAIYRTLIKANVQPEKDFIKKIDDISNKYKLKE